MRSFALFTVSLSALAAAKELPKDEVKAAKMYDSGIKHMNNIALKEVCTCALYRLPYI